MKMEWKAKKLLPLKRKLLMEKLFKKKLKSLCCQVELGKLQKPLKMAIKYKPKNGN